MTNNSIYRNVPKRNRQNPKKVIQLNNQIPKGETSENAPDYLPYSVYSNLEQLKQKAQEDVIHPVENSHAASPQQPSLKPRKRHSRPLKLTGEVNLGTNKFSNRERKQKQKERERPVEERVNTIQETVTNAGRHHHHNNIPNEIETSSAHAPTMSSVFETTQTLIENENTTKSEEKKKLEEKAFRRERLKQKLAQLSPEERQAFLLMKHQRSEAKKKGLIVTN